MHRHEDSRLEKLEVGVLVADGPVHWLLERRQRPARVFLTAEYKARKRSRSRLPVPGPYK